MSTKLVFWLGIIIAAGTVISAAKSSAMDDECPEDDDSMHSAETILRKRLLCNYDTEARPVKDHTKAVQVEMNMILRHISTEGEVQYGDTITAFSWIILEWDDEYLTWNISEHSNITQVRIFSDKIWVPNIVLFNSATAPSSDRDFSSDCIVRFNGFVTCVAHASHTALCDADFTKWPYDTLNCSLIFRTWMYRGEDINLTTSLLPFENEFYRENRFWKIVSVNSTMEKNELGTITYPSVDYLIILKRHSSTHAALIVGPAIVMISLTLTSILLKLAASERIYLLGVNLISQFLYLQHLSWYVPSHGDACPLVVLFYRDSLVMTTVVLIATAAMRTFINKKTATPKWINIAIAISNSTPGRWIMYASDDSDDLDKIVNDSPADIEAKPEHQNTTDWKNFVKILNRLLLLIVVVTYLGLFVAMILH